MCMCMWNVTPICENENDGQHLFISHVRQQQQRGLKNESPSISRLTLAAGDEIEVRDVES